MQTKPIQNSTSTSAFLLIFLFFLSFSTEALLLLTQL